MVVHGRISERESGVHVGFVVSKAVGGAVVRNTVRRRLRGLVMEHIDTMPPGADVVVRALPAAASAEYAVLGADLRSAMATSLRRAAARRVDAP